MTRKADNLKIGMIIRVFKLRQWPVKPATASESSAMVVEAMLNLIGFVTRLLLKESTGSQSTVTLSGPSRDDGASESSEIASVELCRETSRSSRLMVG